MGIPALTQPKRTILPAESGYDSTDPGGEGVPPSVPAVPQLVAGDGQLSVYWSAVSGAATYDVIYNTANSAEGATAFSGNPVSGTSAVIAGLENGTTYYVFVRATNEAGSSEYSESVSGAPYLTEGVARKTVVIEGKEMLAPNIIARRTLQGVPGDTLSRIAPEGEIGDLEIYAHREFGVFAAVNGDIGMLGCKDANNNYSPVCVRTPEIVKRFRIMRTECVPTGAIMPGWKAGDERIAPGQFPGDSGMKSCWVQYDIGSGSAGYMEPDIAIGQNTHGNLGVLGNSINFGTTTRYFSGGAYPHLNSDGHWDWDGWNHISYWQDCDAEDPVNGLAPIQLMYANGKTNAYKTANTQIQNLERPVFKQTTANVPPPENMGYKVFPVNDYKRLGVEGRQLATKDYYVAVQSADGVEDYKQCVYLAHLENTADITTQTGWKTMVPAVWTASDGSTTVAIDTTDEERQRYNCVVVWHDDGISYTISELN